MWAIPERVEISICRLILILFIYIKVWSNTYVDNWMYIILRFFSLIIPVMHGANVRNCYWKQIRTFGHLQLPKSIKYQQQEWESDPNHGIESHVVVPVAQLSTKHADPMETKMKHKFNLDCFTSVVEFVYWKIIQMRTQILGLQGLKLGN